MAKPPKPGWNDLPAKYLNPGRKGILGIVLHDTDGSGTHGDTTYLANPTDGRKVSVDFTVERNGSIWKLNPDLQHFFTNHAGRSTRWRNYLNAQVNAVTIGIEITQKSNLSLSPLYPQAQIQAVANLCAWLTAAFDMAASDITTHRQIITDGSRSDPRQFPFDSENGFWHFYWAAYGQQANYLASLKPDAPDRPGNVQAHGLLPIRMHWGLIDRKEAAMRVWSCSTPYIKEGAYQPAAEPARTTRIPKGHNYDLN